MQILFHEKEGDECMTRRKFYLAFLLILGLLAFAGCADYDGVPEPGPDNGIMDNNGNGMNGIGNDQNGFGNGQNGIGNGQNGLGNDLNNGTTNNGLNNNNNLNQ
jgi:hypothetical protein